MFPGTFLDVNHFSGLVKSSNLLLRHPNTSVDVVEGLEEARSAKSPFSSTFLDVNDFLGISKSSNLFFRHPNTSADVLEGLVAAFCNILRNTSCHGRPRTHQFISKY